MTFGRNIQKTRIELACFGFHVGLLFINSESNANFDAVSSKRANFNKVQFFKTHKLIIFGAHNL